VLSGAASARDFRALLPGFVGFENQSRNALPLPTRQRIPAIPLFRGFHRSPRIRPRFLQPAVIRIRVRLRGQPRILPVCLARRPLTVTVGITAEMALGKCHGIQLEYAARVVQLSRKGLRINFSASSGSDSASRARRIIIIPGPRSTGRIFSAASEYSQHQVIPQSRNIRWSACPAQHVAGR